MELYIWASIMHEGKQLQGEECRLHNMWVARMFGGILAACFVLKRSRVHVEDNSESEILKQIVLPVHSASGADVNVGLDVVE